MRFRNEIELCGFFQRHSSSIRPSNPGHHSLENRAPIAQTEKPQPACAKQNGYCCARPQGLCANLLRTTFAILYFPFIHLWLDHCTVVSSATRGGVRCCTRGGIRAAPERGSSAAPEGVKMAGATPPRLRTSTAALDPRMAMRITWASASLPTGGGRSRHNDPCGKARIAEG